MKGCYCLVIKLEKKKNLKIGKKLKYLNASLKMAIMHISVLQ